MNSSTRTPSTAGSRHRDTPTCPWRSARSRGCWWPMHPATSARRSWSTPPSRSSRSDPAALFSTLGRVAARGIETLIIAEAIPGWIDELSTNIMKKGDLRIHEQEKWEPSTWPAEANGFGLHDAPRGALGHWVAIAEWEDRELPGGRAEHLEPLPARREGDPGPCGVRADRDPGRRPEAAARDPPDGPFLRPLHGLRGPRRRRQGEDHRNHQGDVSHVVPERRLRVGGPGAIDALGQRGLPDHPELHRLLHRQSLHP